MPPPAQLKSKRSRPHATRSGKHSGQFFRVKKCRAAEFTGVKCYDFSSIHRHSQTTLTKDGEASKITYLHNAKGQRVFKSEAAAAGRGGAVAPQRTTYIEEILNLWRWM